MDQLVQELERLWCKEQLVQELVQGEVECKSPLQLQGCWYMLLQA
jgi:hypothetical protein